MELSDFKLYEITDANLRAELSKKLDIDEEFVQTKPNLWMAEFNVDGIKYEAAIREGHRRVAAADNQQADIQLRIRDEHLNTDTFLSVRKIQEITRLVNNKFSNRHHA